MQTDNRFLDDLARLASSALGTFQGLRVDVEARFKERFERWLADMNLVRREEFEVVRAMAAGAREENERLAARIAALEAQIGGKK
jgi:BMFP domain-containing protein YqiC